MKKNNPLEFALKFEIKGTNLYLKLAGKANNPLTKQLFYSLAMQETDHAKRVDEINMELKKNDNARNQALHGTLPDVESILKNFFQKAKGMNLRSEIDNVRIYELAMEMEKTGYETYKKFNNTVKSETEKIFFMQLANEEKEHLNSLENVYYYLTNNGDWLQENESKIWSWMNL